ncbi:MAG TPA: glycosyltransferase [Friedmanniella sp.]
MSGEPRSARGPGSGERLRLAYFVPPSKQIAGIERVTHEIADGLARAYPDELDVHVVYSSSYPELADLGRTAAYRLHSLGRDRVRAVGPALRRCVAENRLEVLVTPQVEATVVAWLSTRGTGLRAIVPHLHGNPRVEFEEGTRRSRLAFRFFERVVSPRVRSVFAVSPSLRDYAARTIATRTRVVYVPNPVAGRPGADRRWVEDPDVFRFVSVGRLSRQKGQDLLLAAVAEARPRLPAFSVTIVGGGKDLDALAATSTALGLDDVVRLTGHAQPDEHLERADCFVLASRWEGFGVVLVEALQRGVPLLATDCDFGPRDIITDPRIGTLVRPGDVAALADALVAMSSRERRPDEVEVRVQAARQFEPLEAVTAQFQAITGLGLARPGLGHDPG